MTCGDHGRLHVVATGDAHTPGPGRRDSPSRYADPVAWLVTDAVSAALSAAPPDVRSSGPGTGVLTVSRTASLHTMRSVAAGADRGRVSPLRFAGAGPGSLSGLTCTVFGFQGPSLVLTMPPEDSGDIVTSVLLAWLAPGRCRYAVVSEHRTAAEDEHRVHSRVVRLIPN